MNFHNGPCEMKKEHVNRMGKVYRPNQLHDLAADQLRQWQFIALTARDTLLMAQLSGTCRPETVSRVASELDKIVNEPPFAVKGKYATGTGEQG